MATFYCLAMFGSGVVSHVGFFSRGEHHLNGVRYMQLFFLVTSTAVIFHCQGEQPLLQALRYVCCLVSSYLAGVYSSLILYRLLLHPLNKFPGPLGARLSSFWFSVQLKDGDAYRKVHQLHNRYGDFVRVGSSDLSVTHPKAVNAIYGLGSKCTKSAWYDGSLPTLSLQTIRNKAQHDKRRRVWSPAFSDKALRGYEARIQKYQNKLFSQIETSGGQQMNVTKWFHWFSFDVMGDLAFGMSFDMLETSEEHWAIKLLDDGMRPLALLLPDWFFRVITAIPGLSRDWFRLIDYCAKKVDERRKAEPAIPDIMSVLLEPLNGKEPIREDIELLRGDSRLIVIAGSDTTAATLTHVMLELSRHPEHIQKLREELTSHLLDSAADFSHQEISNLEHLNGVICETLRLYPPVPSRLPRKTPPEGIEIGGVYVPGNMTVWAPQYAIGRKENIYTQAEAFIPERWYLHPDMIKEKSAWSPFSTGHDGCIGKPLAMLTLRTTIARLVMRYDIGFPAGDTDRGAEFEARSRDHFTLSPAELNISFKKREM